MAGLLFLGLSTSHFHTPNSPCADILIVGALCAVFGGCDVHLAHRSRVEFKICHNSYTLVPNVVFVQCHKNSG